VPDRIIVLVDANNVRRSQWPNIPDDELVERVRRWASQEGVDALIVFDGRAPVEADDVVGAGRETADDWIAREAAQLARYWLVTSDRELRDRAGGAAERVIGGGTFARELP
jgi:predicted RNA-binding protein with PIN domain